MSAPEQPSGRHDLGPSGEHAWQELRLHTEWIEGFWVAWLFTGNPLLARELEGRMERLMAAREQRQVVLRPSTPEETRALLEQILTDDTREAGCVWVEVVRTDASMVLQNKPGPCRGRARHAPTRGYRVTSARLCREREIWLLPGVVSSLYMAGTGDAFLGLGA